MDIVSFLKQKNIDFSTENDTLDEHSKDASVFEIKPSIVVYPKDSHEISEIVKIAPKDFSISIRAGGTCMSGGSLTNGLILNLTKYFKKIEIDPRSHTATLEMGVYYRDLEKEAEKYGLLFAPYTSSKNECGVAGMLGNNASGEKSIRYGATIDNVEKIWVILDDGIEYEIGSMTLEEMKKYVIGNDSRSRLYKLLTDMISNDEALIKSINNTVVKRASGYLIERVYDEKTKLFNPAKLFIGSQATLGIITKAKLKLIPIPKYRRLLATPAQNLSDLPKILKIIMDAKPEGVETFDNNTFTCAKVCLPEDTDCASKCMGKSHLMILAQFSDDTENLTDRKARDCQRILTDNNFHSEYVTDENLYRSLWNIRRSSFRAMKEMSRGSIKAVPCIEDVIVPIDKFDRFIPSLIKILTDRNIEYGFHGHIGDGALRVIPLFDMADSQTPDRIVELMQSVFDLVKKLGGHMSADHSDGIIRSPFIEDFYGTDIYNLFVKIKTTLDPKNIFNPEKKTGGSLDFLKKYIIKH